METIGFEGKSSTPRFEAFCDKIGAISLKEDVKSDAPFVQADMPHSGRAAVFIPWEFLLKVISHGADAYIEGKLTAHQSHIGKPVVSVLRHFARKLALHN